MPSHTTKAALPTHDFSGSRSTTAAERHVPSTSKRTKSAGGEHLTVDAYKKSSREAPKHTAWTIEAASRVVRASAKRGDGEVKKGSFAADAMSKAMKNAHNLRERSSGGGTGFRKAQVWVSFGRNFVRIGTNSAI